MLTVTQKIYWLVGQSAPEEGGMVAMFDLFGAKMDFKSESCLSFE